MRELISLILHEKYKKSYKIYGGLQCLPNVCRRLPKVPNVCLMSAQCPICLPNVVRDQISDFFRYVFSGYYTFFFAKVQNTYLLTNIRKTGFFVPYLTMSKHVKTSFTAN